MTNELESTPDAAQYFIERRDAEQIMLTIRKAVFSLKNRPKFPMVFSHYVKNSEQNMIYQIKTAFPKTGYAWSWIEDVGGAQIVHFESKGLMIVETKVLGPQDQLLAIVKMSGPDPKLPYTLLGDPTLLVERYLEDPLGRKLAATQPYKIATVIPKYKVISPNGNVIADFKEGPSKEAARVIIDKKSIDPLLILSLMIILGVPQYFTQAQEIEYGRKIKGWPNPQLP